MRNKAAKSEDDKHHPRPYVPTLEVVIEPRTLPEAACANLDDWVFEDKTAERIARAACSRCVLRIDCLKFELETPTSNGIRGGLDAEERYRLRPAYLAKLAALEQINQQET